MPRPSLSFSNRQRGVAVDRPLRDLIRACCQEALLQEAVPFACAISLSFVSPQEIRALNAAARGVDAVTDVLSFPLEEFEGGIPQGYRPPLRPLPLGDIVLCLARAAEQAGEYGHSFARECGFLTVHALLHLLGYDHETPQQEQIMLEKQERVLSALGLERG
ncbi:MAG: rRNA maturation RNase YbeY [Clostridiales bacterium]|nr:rRNA maturation RNase YbeY [Clostridiales bacterium]